MISIILTFTFPDQDASDQSSFIKNLVIDAQDFEGCSSARLLRDFMDPSKCYFQYDWDSVELCEEFIQSDVFSVLINLLAEQGKLVDIEYKIFSHTTRRPVKTLEPKETAFNQNVDIPLPSQVFELAPSDPKLIESKYASSNLNASQIEIYLEKIISEIEQHTPYLDKDLTLRKFAQDIGIHPHHVSRVINEKLGLNFSNFINRYRVEFAKKLLDRDLLQKYTIAGIGNEAGFNSRSAFYNSFKKFTGMSPGDFVEAHPNLMAA